nr:hypothetical protein BCU64_15055 [Vibrio lentus]
MMFFISLINHEFFVFMFLPVRSGFWMLSCREEEGEQQRGYQRKIMIFKCNFRVTLSVIFF